MAARRAQAIKTMGEPASPESLISLFEKLPDPRSSRNQIYPLEEVLFVVLAGILSGFNELTRIEEFAQDKLDWFQSCLPYDNGIPSHDTMGRVLGMLCPDALEVTFERWMRTAERTEGVVAIDGKTLRGAIQRRDGHSFVHMVSAFASNNGVVLGQLRTAEKSNEITAIPRLIESLFLDGAVVTIDAAGCQTAITDAIVQRDADFVIGVKANQPTLLEDLSVAFHELDLERTEGSTTRSEETGHGRGEARRCDVLPAADWLSDRPKWKHVRSFIRITSRRFVNGAETENTRFYVSSITGLNSARAASLVRAHWSIENRLHWCLDVAFNEDRCRVYASNAAENLVVLRHVALNLLRSATHLRGGVGGRRMKCCYSDDTRRTLLAQIWR